jgi:hypothetical protein
LPLKKFFQMMPVVAVMTEIPQLMMSQGHRIPIHQRGKAVTANWLEIQIRIPATPVT